MPGVQIRASILLEHKEDGAFKCPQATKSREERPFAGGNNQMPAFKGERSLRCINDRSFNIPDKSKHPGTLLLLLLLLLFIIFVSFLFCPMLSYCC
jgi:hypothetical protein